MPAFAMTMSGVPARSNACSRATRSVTSVSRSMTTTSAPPSRRRDATASPMPLTPPVTIAFLRLKSKTIWRLYETFAAKPCPIHKVTFMTCRDLMTSDPACCVPRDTVVTAAMIMKNHNVGSVPVVLDRELMRVVGMITDRDITLRVVADQRDYYNTHVEDVMSKDVVMCRVDDDYN